MQTSEELVDSTATAVDNVAKQKPRGRRLERCMMIEIRGKRIISEACLRCLVGRDQLYVRLCWKTGKAVKNADGEYSSKD